jgi:hypothetical protein
MNNSAPFTGPFSIHTYGKSDRYYWTIEDSTAKEVGDFDSLPEAQWIRDRLNAALPQPTEDSRVAFEAWYRDKYTLGYSMPQELMRGQDGAYRQRETESMWLAWQAAPLAAAPAMLTEFLFDRYVCGIKMAEGGRVMATCEAEARGIVTSRFALDAKPGEMDCTTFRLSTKGDAPTKEECA